jgi:protein-disulfide isomerase
MADENLSKKELYDLERERRIKQNQTLNKKSSFKRALIWIGVVILIALSIWGLVKIAKPPSINQQTGNLSAVSTTDWVEGNKDSTNILIEYGDFQCPACGAYYPLVNQLVKDQGQNFKFVFRNFPLQQHQNAKPAAYAAGAAGKQGKFWEMYGMLFENQNNWSNLGDATDTFVGYARSIGLNVDQFNTDRVSADVKDKVQSDSQSGLDALVNATPSFFYNGTKVQPGSYDEFVQLVKQAGQSNQVSPSPTPTTTPTPTNANP